MFKRLIQIDVSNYVTKRLFSRFKYLQVYIKTPNFLPRYYNRDIDVRRDSELASFANEVSSNGLGKTGGIGRVRFRSKATLFRIYSAVDSFEYHHEYNLLLNFVHYKFLDGLGRKAHFICQLLSCEYDSDYILSPPATSFKESKLSNPLKNHPFLKNN